MKEITIRTKRFFGLIFIGLGILCLNISNTYYYTTLNEGARNYDGRSLSANLNYWVQANEKYYLLITADVNFSCTLNINGEFFQSFDYTVPGKQQIFTFVAPTNGSLQVAGNFDFFKHWEIKLFPFFPIWLWELSKLCFLPLIIFGFLMMIKNMNTRMNDLPENNPKFMLDGKSAGF